MTEMADGTGSVRNCRSVQIIIQKALCTIQCSGIYAGLHVFVSAEMDVLCRGRPADPPEDVWVFTEKTMCGSLF